MPEVDEISLNDKVFLDFYNYLTEANYRKTTLIRVFGNKLKLPGQSPGSKIYQREIINL